MPSVNMLRNPANDLHYTAGQQIFTEGDAASEMYVVTDGEVDITYRGRLLEVITTGGIFGEMALVSDQPRSADASARVDCTLMPLDQKRFEYMVQQTPYFAIEVMRVMADRLRRET
jgi:CRP/FNR family transcriptional regulator, cyclic AMP receptor protein